MAIPDSFLKICENHVQQNDNIDFICTNALQTYRTSKLVITKQDNDSWECHVIYYVIKCDPDFSLKHCFPISFDNVSDAIHHVYEFLWRSTVCLECYSLILTDNDTKGLCWSCYTTKIFWDVGVASGFIDAATLCSICMEPVYHSRLECQHWFHKTCFIKLCPTNWYKDQTIHCPLCRKEITQRDQKNYFLSYDY